MLAFGDVRCGFVDLDDEAQPIGQELTCLHRVERRLNFRCQREHLVCNAKLDGFEIARGDFLARGQCQQVKEVLRERILGVEHGGAVDGPAPASRELRISQP